MRRLLRLQGIAEELLVSARNATDARANKGIELQLEGLVQEVYASLADTDGAAADEFQRDVAGLAGKELPAELRTATLVGWLKGSIAAESIEAKREQLAGQGSPKRKHTIGFKIRSPITREPESALPSDSTGST